VAVKLCHEAGLTLRTVSCQRAQFDIELSLAQLAGFHPDVVIGWRLGHRFCKALAALNLCRQPLDYLEIGEQVGHWIIRRPNDCPAYDSWTGAEVTKNAVEFCSGTRRQGRLREQRGTQISRLLTKPRCRVHRGVLP
jgi:hypothetical protein